MGFFQYRKYMSPMAPKNARPAKRARMSGRTILRGRPGTYRSRKRRLARASVGSNQSVIKNAILANTERKYAVCQHSDEDSPRAIQTGAMVHCHHSVLGMAVPPNWNGTFSCMGGADIPQGDTAGSRDGNAVYLENTTLNFLNFMIDAKRFEIPPNVFTLVGAQPYMDCPPLEFRVVLFKSKIRYLAGGTHDPGTNLFKKEGCIPFGEKTAGVTAMMDLFLYPTNKLNFTILRDFKFTLSKPSVTGVNVDPETNTPGNVPQEKSRYFNGYSGKYETSKTFMINLPHNTRVNYANAGTAPIDYNPAWAVCIFARCQGNDVAADQWEISVRGESTFKDL